MLDKITIKSRLTYDECHYLAEKHFLKKWINSEHTTVEFRSSEYSNISGIIIKIQNNILTLKTSLHKYWNKINFDKLRNDDLFSIYEAKLAFEYLLDENRLKKENVKIIQFEFGLNLNVNFDPITFIELSRSINTGKFKEFFIDATYRINRQRTTPKHKDIRKYFKIYDKGWEMRDKQRRSSLTRDYPDKIVRIESCYKRYNILATQFFSNASLKKFTNRFYNDWINLNFHKEIIFKKGCRTAEIERVRIIVNEGKDYLAQQNNKDRKENNITLGQHRTVSEFIRDFDKNKHKYEIQISPQEKEFKQLLINTFKSAVE